MGNRLQYCRFCGQRIIDDRGKHLLEGHGIDWYHPYRETGECYARTKPLSLLLQEMWMGDGKGGAIPKKNHSVKKKSQKEIRNGICSFITLEGEEVRLLRTSDGRTVVLGVYDSK